MRTLRALVPLDGSPLSEAVLPLVERLGAAETALLRVLEDAPPGDRAAEAEARAYLEGVAERLRGRMAGAVAVAVGRGKAAEAILEVASRRGSGIIALATAGRSGFDRLVLGSVAEKVIRASPVPVLALRAPGADAASERGLFERVLVPHDGRDRSFRAVEALSLLGAGAGTELALLGVIEAWEETGERGRPDDLVERALRLEAEKLRDRLERAAIRARDLGFRVTVEVETGPPADRIVDRAASLGATLLAMATHGRSGPSRWALGSVTEHVLRASETPLLIAR